MRWFFIAVTFLLVDEVQRCFSAGGGDAAAIAVDQPDQRLDIRRRPTPRHQLLARSLRIRCAADQADHFVDVGDCDRQADQHIDRLLLRDRRIRPRASVPLAEKSHSRQLSPQWTATETSPHRVVRFPIERPNKTTRNIARYYREILLRNNIAL